MKRPLIAIAVLVGFAGAVYLARPRFNPAPPAVEAMDKQDEGTSVTSSAVRRAPLQQLWPKGVEYEYAFEEISNTLADGQLFAHLSMSGRLFVVRLDDEFIQYRFEGDLKGTLGPSADLSALEGEAQKPFFVGTARDGQIRLRVEPGVSSNVGQIWRALVATVRLEMPEQNLDTWQTTESGPLGSCLMQHERTGMNTIRKSRTSCSVPAGAQLVAFQSQTSEQNISLANTRLESLTSKERLLTESIQGTPVFEAETNLNLMLLNVSDRSADVVAWIATARGTPGALIDLAPAMAKPGGPLNREELLARIGDRTFPGVMTKLLDFQKITSSRQLTSEENAAFGRSFVALRSMLQLDSKHIAEVEKHILADGPLTQHLLGVLGEAGTREAQVVLSRYLEDTSRDARNRTLAGIAMARLESPNELSVASLRRMQSDPMIADQATYALGSNVKRLAGTNPPLKKDVIEGLLAGLDNAPQDEKERYMAALGNAGDPAALPKLAHYANSEYASDRKNAANGARQIPGAEAEGLLVKLLGDPEDSVRSQAAQAIVSRDPSPQLVTALSSIMVSEPNPSVRAKAVNGAASWLRVTPDVVPALRAVAQNDQEESLRLTAASALDKYGF